MNDNRDSRVRFTGPVLILLILVLLPGSLAGQSDENTDEILRRINQKRYHPRNFGIDDLTITYRAELLSSPKKSKQFNRTTEGVRYVVHWKPGRRTVKLRGINEALKGQDVRGKRMTIGTAEMLKGYLRLVSYSFLMPPVHRPDKVTVERKASLIHVIRKRKDVEMTRVYRPDYTVKNLLVRMGSDRRRREVNYRTEHRFLNGSYVVTRIHRTKETRVAGEKQKEEEDYSASYKQYSIGGNQNVYLPGTISTTMKRFQVRKMSFMKVQFRITDVSANTGFDDSVFEEEANAPDRSPSSKRTPPDRRR